MNSTARNVLIFLAAAVLGWFLIPGGERVGSGDLGHASGRSLRASSDRHGAVSNPRNPVTNNGPLLEEAIPMEAFVGIHELDGQRSALRIADFLIENPENEPAVAALGTWFGWSGEEMSQLQKIVHGHAQRVRAWEQRMMRSQSTGNGTGEVEWRYADPVTGSVLEAELSAAFGTENARLLTIRGDLARFSVPFPDMERRGDPSVRIEFRETQTWGFAKFANADRSVRAASRINAENPARRGRATTGEKTFERFAHLFDYSQLATEVSPSETTSYPVADLHQPGIVVSPYSGQSIDVDGFTPGMLVLDPTFPPSDKCIFRIPEAKSPLTESE